MNTSKFYLLLRYVCALMLIFIPIGISAQSTSPRVIEIDYNQVKGKRDNFFKHTVGAGRAAEGLRADWQRDLAIVHRECGFEYIRFHGLLEDELGIYGEDRNGNPVYNFQYVDMLYDAILKTGMKPFVEFGFMPRALASGSKTIFWWKGNVTPPKNYDKWGALIKALVEHWTKRYGRDEVKQWYFEIWNEPNLDGFWAGTQEEYFKLYAASVKAIKSVSSDYRVGGPATAGNAWVPETIKFAKDNSLPLDFITTHDYGVRGEGVDEFGVQKLFLDASPNAIIGNVRNVRSQIKSSAMPNLPLYYTEWSTSYSPRDPVHDSYISAPYILSKLKGTEGYADSMSYWTFTDNFEEPGPVPSPFHGGFGLINLQGLRKPSFYAYQFLNKLGDTELKSNDADSWAARGAKGVQVLFWNYTPPKTTETNHVLYTRDFPAKDFGNARVSISNLAKGSYRLDVYKVGYNTNDVYTAFLKMGLPKHLTREQIKELTDKTDGRPVMTSQIEVKNGQPFTKDFPLRENEVYLITLTR